jgi:adenylylsulfate kinase-like enzyme
MVIWLTGLSGSGKTTIGKILYRELKPKLSNLVFVDGDTIRDIFLNDLGFDLSSRVTQISRVQNLVRFLEGQGLNVIVSALYSNPLLLRTNREIFSQYFEVYVETPMNVLEARDTKNLYRRSRDGLINNVVGIDIEWTPPQNPDLVVNTTKATPENSALVILKTCRFFNDISI